MKRNAVVTCNDNTVRTSRRFTRLPNVTFAVRSEGKAFGIGGKDFGKRTELSCNEQVNFRLDYRANTRLCALLRVFRRVKDVESNDGKLTRSHSEKIKGIRRQGRTKWRLERKV